MFPFSSYPLDLYLSISLSLAIAGLVATNLALWRVCREQARHHREITRNRADIKETKADITTVVDAVNVNATACNTLLERVEEIDFVNDLKREVNAKVERN